MINLKSYLKFIIAILIVALTVVSFTKKTSATEGIVVYKKNNCDYFIVKTPSEYALLRWLEGIILQEGDILDGDFESYDVQDIPNLTYITNESIKILNDYKEKLEKINKKLTEAQNLLYKKLQEEPPSPPQKVDTLKELEPWKKALINLSVLMGNIQGAQVGLPHLGLYGYQKMAEATKKEDEIKFLESIRAYELQLQRWKIDLERAKILADIMALEAQYEKEALDHQVESALNEIYQNGTLTAQVIRYGLTEKEAIKEYLDRCP